MLESDCGTYVLLLPELPLLSASNEECPCFLSFNRRVLMTIPVGSGVMTTPSSSLSCFVPLIGALRCCVVEEAAAVPGMMMSFALLEDALAPTDKEGDV